MRQHIQSTLQAIQHCDTTRAHLNSALGASIRNWRHETGASLRAVAGAAGLDHAFLHRIEEGRVQASRASIEKIMAALASMSTT